MKRPEFDGELFRYVDELEDYANAIESETKRLRDEMKRYLPVIEWCENQPELWDQATVGKGIATANGYRAALQEPVDE